MFPSTADHAFRRFRRSRNPAALATVFDRTAPELFRLARHLAADEATAEDLLQATFVTAIEAAGDYDGRRRVLPWLLGILANQARAARRRARRAPDPARLRAETVDDPGRKAEERELRAELGAAIARLPDTYRPVLRLHLEQGMSAQDIARTLERPPGTVRAQIARGLQLVRRSLPVGLTAGAAIASTAGRGLAAVRAAVLGRWQPQAGGTVAALSTGAILMLHKNLILALSGALLFLILGVAVFLPEVDQTPPVEAAGTGSATLEVATAADPPEPETANARELVTPAPAHDTVAGQLATEAATGALRVRVLRPGGGAPAADIGVAIRDLAALQDLAYTLRFVPTDENGEVVFADLPVATYMIELDRAGRVAAAQVRATEETTQEVVLPAGVTVEGEVVDDADRPVPDAAILLHASRMGATKLARTDIQGRFRITDLADGVELQARKAGHTPSLATRVRGEGGAEVALRLVLEDRGHRLQGRVLGSDGAPVAGATVALLPASARDVHPFDRGEAQVRATFVSTGEGGGFLCDEAPAGTLLVLAHADSAGSAPAVTEVMVEGDTWVELRLPAGATIDGRFTRDGSPLAGVDVLAFLEQPVEKIGYLGNLIGMRRATTAADGTFRIAGVMEGGVHLRAHQGMDSLGEKRVALTEGEVVRWDLTLGESEPLRVRVSPPLDPDNRGPWMVMLAIPSQGGSRIGLVKDGAVEFGELPDADCTVQVVRMRRSDFVTIARRDGLRAGQEVTIEIPEDRLALCTLRGRAVDRMRAPIRGATLLVTAAGDGALTARLQCTTGEDGAFETGTLPPGRYRVTLKIAGGTSLDGGSHVVAINQDLDLGDLVFDL